MLGARVPLRDEVLQSTRRLFCRRMVGDNIAERAGASIGMSIADGTVFEPFAHKNRE